MHTVYKTPNEDNKIKNSTTYKLISSVSTTGWFTSHPLQISNTATSGVYNKGDCVVTVGPNSYKNSHQGGGNRQ